MDLTWMYIVIMTVEICGLGIAIGSAVLKFYSNTIQKLQNHEDRLIFMEEKLSKIENKIDELNGKIK